MRPLTAALALLAIVVLAACDATASPTPAAAPTDDPTATAAATPTPAVATAEPVPTDELGDFTCDLPLVEPATVAAPANLTDVRVGSHDGFDRVVWEFAQGTPDLSLEAAQPPFAHDASGERIEVAGESFLRLTMRGGTKQTETGESSYDGPTDVPTGFDRLVHVVEGGDFEAQSTWYLGLSGEACVRIVLLTDPHRVVVDVRR